MNEQRFREGIDLIGELLKVFVPAKAHDGAEFVNVLNNEDKAYIQSELEENKKKKNSDEKVVGLRVRILEKLLQGPITIQEVKKMLKDARESEGFKNRKSFGVLYSLYYNKYKPDVKAFMDDLKNSILNDYSSSEIWIDVKHFDGSQNQGTDGVYLSLVNSSWNQLYKNSDRGKKNEILNGIMQFRLETAGDDKIKFGLFTNDKFVEGKYQELSINNVNYKTILDEALKHKDIILKNRIPSIIDYVNENVSKYNSNNIELRRKEFLEKYPLEKLKDLTPIEYNTGAGDGELNSFTGKLNIKGEKALTFATNGNFCLFYNENGEFKVARKMQFYLDKTNNDVLQAFQLFKNDLYNFIKDFDVSTYKIHEFLDGSDNYKIALLLMYRGDLFVGIGSQVVSSAIANELKIYPVNETKRTRDIDLIGMNIIISNYLKEKIPDIVDRYGYNVLGQCLYDYAKLYLSTEKDEIKIEKTETKTSLPTTPTPKMTNSKLSLNTILYGVPGTGKTYNTVNYAVAAIEGKDLSEICKEEWSTVKEKYNQYKSEGQIVFTTFHQSFGYEDFIEGIKAKVEDNGNINYEVESGIFKNLCEVAESEENITTATKSNVDVDKVQIFKMSLGEVGVDDGIYDYCIENDVISLGFGDIDFTPLKKNATVKEIKEYMTKNYPDEEIGFTADAIFRFKSWMNEGDLVIISKGNLYLRAIGKVTSEYYYDENSPIGYKHFRKVEWLLKNVNIPYERINTKKFSQQSIYNLKDDSIKETSLKLDEIKSLIGEKKSGEKRNYVLIIDEINRGNISKIFGELITLIEPNKRLGGKEQIKVKLPYSQKEFGVPNNLYILGTMNTADRSIALMDLALRRRFTFKEIEPDSSLLEGINVNGINVRKFFDTVNKRIEFLYDRDHLLGHAYFLPLRDDPSLERLNHIVLDKVIPLLQEYFHDDWEKIQLVLGKGLIQSEEIIASDILGTDTTDYEDQTRYYINFNPTTGDYNI